MISGAMTLLCAQPSLLTGPLFGEALSGIHFKRLLAIEDSSFQVLGTVSLSTKSISNCQAVLCLSPAFGKGLLQKDGERLLAVEESQLDILAPLALDAHTV